MKKDRLINLIYAYINKLCKRIENFNETDLDKLILPNHLLGKITNREMLYFTAYHVGQH
jgi:hypothetical protein